MDGRQRQQYDAERSMCPIPRSGAGSDRADATTTNPVALDPIDEYFWNGDPYKVDQALRVLGTCGVTSCIFKEQSILYDGSSYIASGGMEGRCHFERMWISTMGLLDD